MHQTVEQRHPSVTAAANTEKAGEHDRVQGVVPTGYPPAVTGLHLKDWQVTNRRCEPVARAQMPRDLGLLDRDWVLQVPETSGEETTEAANTDHENQCGNGRCLAEPLDLGEALETSRRSPTRPA